MDGSRFDSWARLIATGARSRRGLLQLGLGAGAATVAGGILPGEALACRKDERDCDPEKKNQCCSGKCKRKRDGKGVCKRVPNAFGCTIKDDTCNKPIELNTCPKRPERSCVILDNGRPFCIAYGICTNCESDRDCKLDGKTGKCIKRCPICEGQGSRLRICVFAEAPTPEM